MTVPRFKQLAILFAMVGILLLAVNVVGTIEAKDIGQPGPGPDPIDLANDFPTFAKRYYLHNNPTPPTADTDSQADLPLDETAPTATTLYNYDQDRDSFAGLIIKKGGVGVSESDSTKYQNWRTGALSEDLTINFVINFALWSALKDFNNKKRGHVQAFLRDFDGTSYTEITNVELNEKPWDASSATWVRKNLTFPSVNYTVVAGNQLEVKILVHQGSTDDMWFAYDTTPYYSELQFKWQ